MWLLRIILLVVAALLWAFFAYVVIDSSIIHPHKEPIFDYVVVYGILIYLGVNFIYLLLGNQPSDWRMQQQRREGIRE